MTPATPPISEGEARAAEALRRCASLIEGWSDVDRGSLWQDGRATEASWWRHVWWYTVRTALEIPEEDIRRAVTRQHVQLGVRTARAFERSPKQRDGETDPAFAKRRAAFRARPQTDRPLHHDTVASGCHQVEAAREDEVIAGWLDDLADELRERMRFGSAFRADLERTSAPLLERHRAAKRETLADLRADVSRSRSVAARIVAERKGAGG